ncbi:probable beta-D-xylosidase 6 [Chenopodium quinoa]|uniref:Fibronectin type III-like domain-containing protein n=1 Tax=Chenopodium quinoa TaxID=63459 RepID=A0A803L1Z6_CHEQI|nr:probable beta-D-xylosidase 6 [Chenopodium quinoa]
MEKYSAKFLFSFTVMIVILSSLLQTKAKAAPNTPIPKLDKKPQFPCKAPHNSYPFCNKSLSIPTRSQQLVSLLTLEEKISFLCNNFTGIPRLGIPPYQWWSESLHGIATNGPGISFNGPVKSATLFPQVINSAASFNRSLWFDTATAIAVEGRAMYNSGQAGLTFWAPNVNIFRDPRWGRGQETPGEDPFLVSSYALEFVKGFQGEYWGEKREFGNKRVLEQDHDAGLLMLSACCKHFTAYDLEKWANFTRYSFNAVVTEQDMEDTYEPPFKSCVQQGKASCLMCPYNSINGVPGCAKGDLLQKVRKDWGFKGYIASDCDAVATIYEYQYYVKTPEDAVAEALKAGVDINCGTYMLYNTQSAIGQGKLKEGDIDQALNNLFPVLLRLGLFNGDPLNGMFGRLGGKDVCTKEHQRLALEAARQGIVLLKNDNFLPINKDHVSSLAIIGPGANSTSYLDLGGGYSGFPCNAKSYVEAFQPYIKKTNYVKGCLDVDCESNSMFDEAVHVAKVSDYVILVVGLDLTQETEDKDRVTLLLPGKQMDLVSLVASVSNKRIILVLTGGGPLDVSFAEGDSRVASILWTGYPGEAGGKALAEVIFGDYNPGGRLPMTWYLESFTQIPMNNMNMRADPSRLYPGRTHRFYTGEVVYEFGYGLSYTNYTYKLLSAPNKLKLIFKTSASLRKLYVTEVGIGYVPTDELLSCDIVRFNVQLSVMNVGHMDGSHVVLLYSNAASNIEGAPRKQLIGFSRIHTTAHRSTDMSFSVDPCEHLSFANEHGQRILPLGEHILMIGELKHSLLIDI